MTITGGALGSGPYTLETCLGFADSGAPCSTTPIPIGSVSPWAQVSDGVYDTVAIKTDGTLWAWGYNAFGELGDGATTQESSPEQIGAATNWGQVSAGWYHTVAIKTNGTLWAWGDNSYGELGDGTWGPATCGTFSCSKIPIQIGTASNWTQVSAGDGHTVAIKTNGTLWAWGDNSYGELGDGTTTPESNPEQIGTATNWAQVSAGSGWTVAIKTNGTLWAWGGNELGQVGRPTTGPDSCAGPPSEPCSKIPIQIGSGGYWAQVSAGGGHAVALKEGGSLWTWGDNGDGELGNGNDTGPDGCSGGFACSTAPIRIGTATDWAQVSAGAYQTLGIKTDGTLWAWGDNSYGELGDGNDTGPNSCHVEGCSTAPIQIGTATDWAQVSAGVLHSMAIQDVQRG